MPCSKFQACEHPPGIPNRIWQHLDISASLRLMIATAILLAGQNALARDLGVIGPVYPIAEPSLIEMIQAKLREMQANGALARLQQDSQARMRREVEQPTPVAGISKTTRARSYHFDPSIEVPYPILDAEGRVSSGNPDSLAFATTT